MDWVQHDRVHAWLRGRLDFSVQVLMVVLGGAAVSWSAWSAPATNQSVKGALARAVAESEGRLGPLDPWKKRIFDEEVVPQYSRFIKDYRPGANGLVIEIDYEAILRYIAFYAPRTLKPADPRSTKIALYHRVEAGCDRCVAAAQKIRALMRPRVERRGFQVVWVTDAEVGGGDVGGQPLFQKLVEVASEKGAQASLLVETRIAPVDPLDAAHADERKYLVDTYLLARPTGEPDLKFVGQLIVLENDSLETSVLRLLSDAFSQFGHKAIALEKLDGESKNQEFELVVSGVRDYPHFVKLKQALRRTLTDAAWVEERKIRRGQVVFGIRSSRSIDAVRRQLASVPTDDGKVVVTGAAGERMEAEVRP